MHRLTGLVGVGLFAAVLQLCSVGNAATPQRPQLTAAPVPDRLQINAVNDMVPSARHGNKTALANLTNSMLLSTGVPPDLARALGISRRIMQAELNYQNGRHTAIHEVDVVKAVNNLGKSFGAPAWVQTNQAEVRRLRMHLFVLYPNLFGSQRPADAKGVHEAVSPEMSPLEASWVALALIYQKRSNPAYQTTSADLEHGPLSATERETIGRERTAALDHVLEEGTAQHSIRDLLSLSDNFFSDLNIAPTAGEEGSSK